MSYIIKSGIFVFGNKKQGEEITEKELHEAGCNIEALVAANHLISAKSASKLVTESEIE